LFREWGRREKKKKNQYRNLLYIEHRWLTPVNPSYSGGSRFKASLGK
jgi:hypothetical protein